MRNFILGMKNKQVITTGKQSRRDYRSVERNTPAQSGMPSGMPLVIMDAYLTECRVRRERCASTELYSLREWDSR
jgi:hypothetical protein